MTAATASSARRGFEFGRFLGLALWWLAAGATAASAADVSPPRPVPTSESAGKITVPDGFRVTLFAGEPDVVQPIAMAFDARGRLWVAECFSYPEWEMKGGPGHDRVVIFEDADGDGRFDKRTVFADNLTNLSGLELGFGGVWACCTPNLVFIPDKNGDDRPDGPAQVVLDGWDLKARHNVFNGLTWGPDGWLWGCNGILSNSRVGPPGTPDDRRVALNCGVWRYHPTRKVFEAVAHGTTNPWGLDFDEYGEAFITNCVIPHLFHVIPGAHFQRMFGQDINPYSYGLLESCADHVHWDRGAERWLDIRARGVTPTTDKLGGGHAHSGAMVLQGGSVPSSYRNSILMGNIHGNRLNRDRLERSGSGYVARHEADFLMGNDRWFRSVAQKLGPGGAVYVADWSDTGECHEDDADGAHRENGRIYRVASTSKRVDLVTGLTDHSPANVVRFALSADGWETRQARRLLQEWAEEGRDLGEFHKALGSQLDAAGPSPRRLRALWALYVSGGITPTTLQTLLNDDSEHLRSWAVRLSVEDLAKPLPDATADRFVAMAASDPSAKVRLALASALQRLPMDRRAAVADRLVRHAEDAQDRNLPLMVWYGVEPLVPGDLARASSWAASAGIPSVRRYIARRVVETDAEKGLGALLARFSGGDPVSADAVLDVTLGMADGLRGRKSSGPPSGWERLVARASDFSRPDVSRQVQRLGVMLGDRPTIRRLLEELRVAGPADQRLAALEALAETRLPDFAPALIERLDDAPLRAAALRALAVYDGPDVARAILDRYKALSEPEREVAVETLAARPAWALALLRAVGRGEVPRGDVSVAVARQIQAFGRKDLNQALADSWGALRPASAEKTAEMSKYKAMLTPEILARADPARGRVVFERTCRSCHKLYGEGGDVGPELTGSNRDNLDYVLTNVLDPSASVGNDYRLTNVATTDGRLVSGLLREQTPAALVIQTVNGRVVVPREEVEELRPTSTSMMPEGIFEKLSDDEVRDLVSYLAARAQVPLPAQGDSGAR